MRDGTEDRTPPLAGLRVIELDAIGPVPFAGRTLRLMGAEITRVVPPARRELGLPDAKLDLMHRGKSRIALDLKDDAGRAALTALLEHADVLLEGFRAGVLERLDLAPATLLARHPRLVVGRLSGFGGRGPYARRAGHDINFLALSGVLAAIGGAERPVVPLNLVADFGGGAMHLVAGVLAALVRRGIDGRGSVVETSLLGATLALTPMLHEWLGDGRWTLEREANLLDGAAPFYRVYGTRDGRFVAVGAIEPRFYAELLALSGLAGRLDPARQNDRAHWPEATRAFAEAFLLRDRDDWASEAATRDCCLTPVLALDEALAHPQGRACAEIPTEPVPHPARVLRFGNGA